MFFPSPKFGRFGNTDIILHWTMWVLPLLVLGRGFFLYSTNEAILQAALVLGVYLSLFLHELAHLAVARRVKLRLRSVTLYPIGGIPRLAEIAERPWKEIWVAVAGPVAHAAIAGAIAVGFLAANLSLSPQINSPAASVEIFFDRLFWLNVMLALFHVLPAFPMDGGRIFRGGLALSTQRLRATEVAAMLSSLVALLFIVPGMLWISEVWWMIAVGIVIHVCGQQELLSVRYFTDLQKPGTPLVTPILVPIEQMLDDDSRPEPHFTGVTWNRKTRLWIVWNDGQPVSANALVGE